ncbi:MAG: His/Gly/Thr/Pro-type tRNA ligase C-terminal domain-containing protein, partial [Candidatus Omnitrophica bacterium]|nr:His/Gly/Thr/Pro-type tRNA ligase C-terminal domain-containing protein [Candidatus Omnitrophota bacterium]
GAMPLWLAPTQCVIIPVSEKAIEYAKQIEFLLAAADLRVTLDARNERLQKKIRDAEVEKMPYMVIIGEKEASEGTLSIRSKAEGDIGKKEIEEFIQMLKKEIEEKVR